MSPEASDSNGAPIPATSSVASSTTPTGGACCPSVSCRRVSSTLGGEDNEEINGANGNDATNDPEVNDILFAANKSFEKEQGNTFLRTEVWL